MWLNSTSNSPESLHITQGDSELVIHQLTYRRVSGVTRAVTAALFVRVVSLLGSFDEFELVGVPRWGRVARGAWHRARGLRAHGAWLAPGACAGGAGPVLYLTSCGPAACRRPNSCPAWPRPAQRGLRRPRPVGSAQARPDR
jgi:hypothetical protein